MNLDICRCCAGTIDFDNDAVVSVFETINEMLVGDMIFDCSGIRVRIRFFIIPIWFRKDT